MEGDLVDVVAGKRGRGRGRGTRARGGRGGRGRGRGRGKKAAVVVSSDEEVSLDGNSVAMAMEDAEVATVMPVVVVPMETTEDVVLNQLNKENEGENQATVNCASEEPLHPVPAAVIVPVPVEECPRPTVVLPQTIDMEADISQLEAPTFTTITRGPPEPMLRLKWDNKVNLIGEKVLNPMIHCCDQCDKPILLYGRMIPCKHVFCLKCARAEPVKVCPRCNDKVVRVEQSGLGTVFMCTHGGSRYGNTGCRRTYLSQRDLQAHINHRHVTQPPPPPPAPIPASNDLKQDVMGMEVLKSSSGQRKLSESSAAANVIQTPTALLLSQRPSLRPPSGIGNILPPGVGNTTSAQASAHSHSTLTQANIARINTANAQECHQGKVALHQTLKKTPITQSHHQLPETVADASYYSSVLNSFGGSGPGGTNNASSSNTNSAAAVGYGYEPAAGMPTQPSKSTTGQGSWQQNQYYR